VVAAAKRRPTDQTALTFFAATAARATRTMRRRSFFMQGSIRR
jgi:hypothetical protein